MLMSSNLVKSYIYMYSRRLSSISSLTCLWHSWKSRSSICQNAVDISHILLRQTWSSREGKLAVISLEEFIDRFEDTVRASTVLRHVFVCYFSRSWLIMFHMWHICGTRNCGTDSTCRYQTFVKMFSIFLYLVIKDIQVSLLVAIWVNCWWKMKEHTMVKMDMDWNI